MDTISPARIEETYKTIRPYIRRTPVIEVHGSDFDLEDSLLAFKFELMQHSGSFKARGAFTNLLTREVPQTGIVAASGGNHGAAVAYASMRLGVPATIFLPSISSPAKVARISQYGAKLVMAGQLYADALEASEDWAVTTGAMRVHAYDQTETLLGQGTVGLELEEQTPQLDTVLAGVGGGGLIGGIAAWFGGRIKVIGVEPSTAPTLTKALEAGEPVDAEAGGIAADSLAPRRVGQLMFPLAQKFIHKVLLVSDEAIRAAQQNLWSRMRVVVEPGGAAAFSALLSGLYKPERGERVGIVLSGGNTTAVDFTR